MDTLRLWMEYDTGPARTQDPATVLFKYVHVQLIKASSVASPKH